MRSPVENAEKDKGRQDAASSPQEPAALLGLVLISAVTPTASVAHFLCGRHRADCSKDITSFKLCNESGRGCYYPHVTKEETEAWRG